MEDAQQRSIRKPPPRTRSSRRPGKATRKRDRTARVNDFSIPPGKRHKIPVPASEENPGVKPGCRDRPRSFCVRMLFPDAFTTPPEARPPTPPAPAGHNTPHRPSSAPPGSGKTAFPARQMSHRPISARTRTNSRWSSTPGSGRTFTTGRFAF